MHSVRRRFIGVPDCSVLVERIRFLAFSLTGLADQNGGLVSFLSVLLILSGKCLHDCRPVDSNKMTRFNSKVCILSAL